MDAIAKIETPDDYTETQEISEDFTEDTKKPEGTPRDETNRDSIEKPIQDDETREPTDDSLGENFVKFLQDSVESPMKPCQDLIENLNETKNKPVQHSEGQLFRY